MLKQLLLSLFSLCHLDHKILSMWTAENNCFHKMCAFPNNCCVPPLTLKPLGTLGNDWKVCARILIGEKERLHVNLVSHWILRFVDLINSMKTQICFSFSKLFISCYFYYKKIQTTSGVNRQLTYLGLVLLSYYCNLCLHKVLWRTELNVIFNGAQIRVLVSVALRWWIYRLAMSHWFQKCIQNSIHAF